VTIQHINTQVTYTIHISHKITPLKTTKQNSSHSYTDSEGHITAKEYSVEKGKEIKLSLTQALEVY
jgi:hypothetical protein